MTYTIVGAPWLTERVWALTTPHTAKAALENSLRHLQVPAGMNGVDVAVMASRLAAETGSASSYPVVKSAIRPEDAEALARNLASGLHLISLAETADPYVRPMLVYYGVAQCFGTLPRAFFTWQRDKLTHGLGIENAKKVGATSATIEERGFFARLATTLNVLEGRTSLFSPLDAASASPFISPTLSPNANVGNRGTPLAPRARIKRVALADLVTYQRTAIDPGNALPPAGHYPASSALLVDVLIVFIAGSLCRYRPLVWRDVLSGKNDALGIGIAKALDNLTHAGVALLLEKLWSPNAPLAASYTFGPYSNPYGLLGAGLV